MADFSQTELISAQLIGDKSYQVKKINSPTKWFLVDFNYNKNKADLNFAKTYTFRSILFCHTELNQMKG